jgi:glutathione S-transferase
MAARKMDDMIVKLYYTPNTIALAPHIALIEAGIDFEAVRIDFSAGQQRSPDYLKLNPKGRVPMLVTERGILTETPAILSFIAHVKPAAQLAPVDDPFAFAQIQSFNSYLCSTVHVAHAHSIRGYRWADDEAAIMAMRRKVPQAMIDCFDVIETRMFTGPWVTGNAFTISDPYLFTITRWLELDGVDVGRFPKVSEHLERMNGRLSVQKAMVDHTS